MQKKWMSHPSGIVTIVMVICCLVILIYYQIISFDKGRMKLLISAPTRLSGTTPRYLADGVHVAIVCANRRFNEMAITNVKSIMFHHRQAYNLTFHIFTDADGEKLISEYFLPLRNNCTNFHVYQIANLLTKAQQFLEKHKLVNTHYSGTHALSKALIQDALPANVHHVLLIDTDVLFVDDVLSVWKQLELFEAGKTALGLAPWYPPTSADYQYKGTDPDPFLAGVVLLDLDVCRSIAFTRLLDDAMTHAYENFGLRSLWTADQVVLNLFATRYPQHFIALPCFVNGHTYHYLSNGIRWKSACGHEYPRNLHVVPSSELTKSTSYFRNWYLVYDRMPIEWLAYCNPG